MTDPTTLQTVSAQDVQFFRTFGYLPLRKWAVDLAPVLFDEIRSELSDAYGSTELPPNSDDGVPGYFLPAMTSRTPTSLLLVESLAPVARALLESPAVVPVYADVTVFFGETPWHTDIGMPVRFVKFGIYADDLDARNGALRFVPGSHREPLCSDLRSIVHHLEVTEGRSIESAVEALPHVVATTTFGDVVALDGKVWHATTGGSRRMQWSLPFIDATDEDLVRRFFDSFVIDAPTRGHDGERFPLYGEDFLRTDLGAELERLGAAEVANARWTS